MRTFVLPLVAAVLAGTPAVAQDSSAAYRGRPDPADRPRNTAPVDSAEAKRWMQRFAQCVVAGDPTGARQLLATSPGSADERDRLVRIAQQRANCLHHGKLRMQGNQVFRHAVVNISEAVTAAAADAGVAVADVDWFIPHQANLRILEGVARRLGIDEAKVVTTVAEHANTSAASIPLAMSVAVADGRIKRGDLLLLEAMGGGLTWGACVVRF